MPKKRQPETESSQDSTTEEEKKEVAVKSPKNATPSKPSSKSSIPSNKLQSSSEESEESSEESSENEKVVPQKVVEKRPSNVMSPKAAVATSPRASASSSPKISKKESGVQEPKKQATQEPIKKQTSSTASPVSKKLQQASEESSEESSEEEEEEEEKPQVKPQTSVKKEIASPSQTPKNASNVAPVTKSPSNSSASRGVPTKKVPVQESSSEEESEESEETESEEEEVSSKKTKVSPSSSSNKQSPASSSSSSGNKASGASMTSVKTPPAPRLKETRSGEVKKSSSEVFASPSKNGKAKGHSSEEEEEVINEKNLVEIVKKQNLKLKAFENENSELKKNVAILQKLIEFVVIEKDEVTREGLLEKKDPIGGKWEEKHVVITKSGLLKVYDTKEAKIPSDLVELSKSTIFAQVEKNSKPKPLFFNVRSNDKRDFLFRCEDKLKKAEWVQSLRDVSKSAKATPAPSSPQNKPEMRKTQSEVMVDKSAPKRRFSFSKKKE